MRRRRQGFTLIEIVIVLTIVGIMTAPFLSLTTSIYREFRSMAMTSALKTECDQAGYEVLRVAAGGGAWHVDADNHGALFANGQRVHWEPGHLLIVSNGRTQQRLLPHVVDCCLVRHGSALAVTISVVGPQHPGGPPVESHGTYQYPEVEALK